MNYYIIPSLQNDYLGFQDLHDLISVSNIGEVIQTEQIRSDDLPYEEAMKIIDAIKAIDTNKCTKLCIILNPDMDEDSFDFLISFLNMYEVPKYVILSYDHRQISRSIKYLVSLDKVIYACDPSMHTMIPFMSKDFQNIIPITPMFSMIKDQPIQDSNESIVLDLFGSRYPREVYLEANTIYAANSVEPYPFKAIGNENPDIADLVIDLHSTVPADMGCYFTLAEISWKNIVIAIKRRVPVFSDKRISMLDDLNIPDKQYIFSSLPDSINKLKICKENQYKYPTSLDKILDSAIKFCRSSVVEAFID